jgi:hypothetical protein
MQSARVAAASQNPLGRIAPSTQATVLKTAPL